MARQVVIVHGWSDTSDSFKPLAQFLKDNGYKTVVISLGDYISLEDDVRIEDVAKRMDAVFTEKIAGGELNAEFDLIVHSTGGLVARQWLATYYPDGKKCPIARLVMLAPANFGSKLATMGQSMLGRVVKGWKTWFHTGKEMLTELSLASAFQWDLAQRDLFVPEGADNAPSPYGSKSVLPFVIVGTHPYTSALRQIVNEDGADGTVRVPAANLNARGISIDFTKSQSNPHTIEWKLRHGEDLMFPLAVLPDRTHASVTSPEDTDIETDDGTKAVLGKLILQPLGCTGLAEYRNILDEWNNISEDTAILATDEPKRNAIFPRKGWLDKFKGEESPEYFHQYMQIVVKIVDDHGAEVDDFFLEFFAPEMKGDKDAVYFHSEVLEDVFVNGPNRCLYVDRTDLLNNFYRLIPDGQPKELAMSVSAAPPGDRVKYFDAKNNAAAGNLIVHSETEEGGGRWLKRNTTHFIKIIVPRQPTDDVFKLKQA